MYRGLNRGQEEMFSILMISFFLPVKLLETPFPRKKKEAEVIGRGTSSASPQEVGQVILGVIITVITRHEG